MNKRRCRSSGAYEPQMLCRLSYSLLLEEWVRGENVSWRRRSFHRQANFSPCLATVIYAYVHVIQKVECFAVCIFSVGKSHVHPSCDVKVAGHAACRPYLVITLGGHEEIRNLVKAQLTNSTDEGLRLQPIV